MMQAGGLSCGAEGRKGAGQRLHFVFKYNENCCKLVKMYTFRAALAALAALEEKDAGAQREGQSGLSR